LECDLNTTIVLEQQLQKKPKGSFLLVDDDKDEHGLFKIAMDALHLDNKFISFYNGMDTLNYLKKTSDDIFVIFSDINMPKMDGLELKRMIDGLPEIKVKAIPFFFHSNAGSPAEIRAAYTLNIQGYLKKATSIDGTVESLKKIVALWTDCIHLKDLKYN